MKYYKVLVFACIINLSGKLFSQENNPYQYINPKPASEMVSNKTNIIFRHSKLIDQHTLTTKLLRVEGSVSGVHNGELLLASDGKTIVFNPNVEFASNEEVNVVMEQGVRTLTGDEIPECSFRFFTASEGIIQLPGATLKDDISSEKIQFPLAAKKGANSVLLPAPTITIDSINNPSPGYIFMATWDRNVPAQYGNFIFVLDQNGEIVDSVRVNGAPFDFQIQQNGLLTYALGGFSANVPLPGEDLQHMVLDENLALVDSFKMKNGYTTDFHEFKMLPNGHVMMMAYHTIIYDLSTVVDSGQTDASLVINIIQEQDRDRNVVFEWRNIDYIPIIDSDEDLSKPRVNYSTLNAFDIDDDGNILASFRNHSEIMKISRETGELLWRMGGRNGEFTYDGEHEENAPYYHARQHNIQRHANGNITLFDNGQYHTPPYSRAIEYELDEYNKVATLVSEWRYPKGNIFCVTAGNAQLLPDGGWFIGYGVPNPQFVKRNAVEVHPDGTIALELSLPDGVLAYRISKLPWKETIDERTYTHYEVIQDFPYSFNDALLSTGIEIVYDTLDAWGYNESHITRVPYGPVLPEFSDHMITVYPVSVLYEGLSIFSQSAEISFDLSIYPEIKDPEHAVVYYRNTPGQGLFIPLETTYDDVNNELLVRCDGFGEFVFGVPYKDQNMPNAPILYEPLDQQELLMVDKVTIRWTGKGTYKSFNVQVSDDSSFTNILHEINTNLSDFSMYDLAKNKEYFWRVNSVLESHTSQWSEVWNFHLRDTTVSIYDAESLIPYGNSLSQNVPNPFSSVTQISYSIQEKYLVSLKIYDLAGLEVRTLVNESKGAGRYSVSFDADGLPNGIYFYKFRVGNKYVEVKKMMLIR